MKLRLVYSPFCWPTAMPFGLTYLKGYLARANPTVAVEIQDLNLAFFSREHFPHLCEECPRRDDLGCLPPELFSGRRQVQTSREFFRTSPDFFDREHYVAHYLPLNAFYNQIKVCFDQLLMPYVASGGTKNHRKVKELLAPDLDRILQGDPDVIGFSANAGQIAYSLALAQLVKERQPVPVILGGYFASSYDAREILAAFPEIDFVVSKEGELALSGLLDALPGRDFAGVGNLAYRRDGKIVVNEETFVRDLDELPDPDFSDLSPVDYFTPSPVFPILLSRGCYWKKCAFCAHFENYAWRYRTRSIDRVVDEIATRVADHGARYFLFCDEQISGWDLNRLADTIIARNLDIVYGLAGFRPSHRITRELLEKAHRSGCRWIYVGVESLTQRLLDLMRKGTRVESVLDVLRWATEVGIKPFVSAFWGFPTQTEDEVRAETELYREHRAYLTLPDDGGLFYLVKNSDVHLNPERYQVEIVDLPVSLTTPSGQVTSIAPRYRRQAGLDPAAAQRIFREAAGDDVPCETGGFWSHLVILSAHGLDLVFPRPRFRESFAEPLVPLFREWLESADDSDANRGKACAHLGAAHERAQQPARAAERYRQALRHLPDHPELLGRLGRTLLATGDPRAALEAARRAAEQRPDNAALYRLVGQCYEEMNDQQAASEAYRQARQIASRQGRAGSPLTRLRARVNRVRVPQGEKE